MPIPTQIFQLAYSLGRQAYINGISEPLNDQSFNKLLADLNKGRILQKSEVWQLKKQWMKAYSDSSLEAMTDLHTNVVGKHLV